VHQLFLDGSTSVNIHAMHRVHVYVVVVVVTTPSFHQVLLFLHGNNKFQINDVIIEFDFLNFPSCVV
jgi:hypothetical protein